MPWAKPGYWTVYRLTCVPSGKKYIGITSDHVNRRWSQHRCHSLRERRGNAIGGAIRKYGRLAFLLEVVATAHSVDEATMLERRHISAEKTMAPNGYNLTDGGEYRKELSAESREKISRAARGRKASPETRAKLSAVKKGRKLNLSPAERLRRGERFRLLTPQQRAATISATVRAAAARRAAGDARRAIAREQARQMATERRAAKVDARRLVWEAGRADRERLRVQRIANWHRGRKRSDATRAKISARASGRIGTPQKRNPTGVAGVRFDRTRQLWRAQITINKKQRYLGRFRTVEEAIAARRSAEIDYGFARRSVVGL